MAFKQVTRENDWGYIQYWVGKPYEGGTDVTDRLTKAKSIRVQFPDKTEKELPIHAEHFAEEVHEMGHHSTVHSVKLHLVFRLRGVDAYIPIEKIKIDL